MYLEMPAHSRATGVNPEMGCPLKYFAERRNKGVTKLTLRRLEAEWRAQKHETLDGFGLKSSVNRGKRPTERMTDHKWFSAVPDGGNCRYSLGYSENVFINPTITGM